MSETRIALVTGANQGVGFQVAKELVAHGVTVYLGSRDLKRGEAAAGEIGPGAIALQIDVTDGAAISAAAERIRSERGRLDLLVNNAGISNTRRSGVSAQEQNSPSFLAEYAKSSKASTASLDEVRAVWDVNVFGTLAVYQAMLPLLRESADARIVNVSSGVARSERRPRIAVPRHVRAHLSRVEGGGKRGHPGDHGRAGVDRHQGQPGFAGVHGDEPQCLCGYGVGRGRVPRGSTGGSSRAGRSDRHLYQVGKHYDPVVKTVARRQPGRLCARGAPTRHNAG